MSGLKFMGKDPAGNAKAISVNNNGNLEIQLADKVIDVFANEPCTAGNSITSAPIEVNGRPVMYGLLWSGSMNSFDLDVEYLSKGDNVLGTEKLFDNATRPKGEGTHEFIPKFPRFRFVVTNNGTINRSITLSVTTQGGTITTAPSISIVDAGHWGKYQQAEDVGLNITKTIGIGVTESLLEVNAPFMLEYFEWGVTHSGWLRIIIQVKDAGGTWRDYYFNVYNTGKRAQISAKAIADYGCGFIDILAYDDNTSFYKLCINRPIYALNGLKISMLNHASAPEEYTVYASGFGRRF